MYSEASVLCVILSGVRGVEGPRIPAACTGRALTERPTLFVSDPSGEGANTDFLAFKN